MRWRFNFGFLNIWKAMMNINNKYGSNKIYYLNKSSKVYWFPHHMSPPNATTKNTPHYFPVPTPRLASLLRSQEIPWLYFETSHFRCFSSTFSDKSLSKSEISVINDLLEWLGKWIRTFFFTNTFTKCSKVFIVTI